jgi:hypothetical protein
MAAIFWHAGRWYEGERPKLFGPMDHAFIWRPPARVTAVTTRGRD